MVRGPLPAFLLLFLVCPPSAARQDASPAAVNAAIERGIDFLVQSQNRDGSWGVDLYERGTAWHDLRDGASSLAVYTLVKCGLTAEHPTLQRALAFLLAGEPDHTYALGMQLSALHALGDGKHEKRMRALLQRLIGLRQGAGWDYPGIGRPDLSNTQIAAVGFRAAKQAGLDVPKGIWDDLIEKALRYQAAPEDYPGATGASPKEKRSMAGFFYEPALNGPKASMTTAGLTILGIAAENQRLPPRAEEARALALNWLEAHFSVAGNPRGEEQWHFYYLYGLERVGALHGLTTIAGHDWYQEGAQQLLKEQRSEGGWWSEGRSLWPPAPMPVANTCFALLFLRKATLSGAEGAPERLRRVEDPDSEVWVRVDPKKTWTLWVSGFSPAVLARFGAGDVKKAAALTVERVQWLLDGEAIAEAPVDGTRPWNEQRYAVQHAPARAGVHEVQCRVFARAGGEAIELVSEPLAVEGELALEPWMLEYPADAAKNLLRAGDVTLTVSSEESAFHPKGDVLDGLQGSSWLAQAEDERPWLRLELEKPLRAKELVLGPAGANAVSSRTLAVLEAVELRLNGDKDALTIRMDPDARKKTRFALPRSTLVRSLELVFTEVKREPGAPPGWIGLAEIELR